MSDFHPDSHTDANFVRTRYPRYALALRTPEQKVRDTEANLMAALNREPIQNDPLAELTRLLGQDEPFKPSS